MTVLSALSWLDGLDEGVRVYLDTLAKNTGTGKFGPVCRGRTEIGEKISMGPSCFALKTYYMLGLWEKLDAGTQESWVRYLQSFQDQTARGTFVDPVMVRALHSQTPWREKLADRFRGKDRPNRVGRLILAETKQVIATLAQVGESSRVPFRDFPHECGALQSHLEKLDWTKPWSAGGQASALAVFVRTQAPRFLDDREAFLLYQILVRFFDGLAHASSGTYFRGETPEFGQLVNGAMKVLTALDWLDVPIHYPKPLIDTCLEDLPIAEGCHVTDWVYVLYRCCQLTEYRRADIRSRFRDVLSMIHRHYGADGGFSYRIGKSKTHYYGIRVSRGLAESDLHSTCLFTWAVTMLSEVLELKAGWKVIKP